MESTIDFRIGGYTAAALTTAGRAYLKTRSESQRFSITVVDTGALGYGTLWDVGDIISVRVPDIIGTIDLQVAEVTTTLAPNAPPALSISLGYAPRQIDTILSSIISQVQITGQSLPEETANAIYLEGAGKTAPVSGDFHVPPPNGSIAVVKNTTTGDVFISVLANSVWESLAV